MMRWSESRMALEKEMGDFSVKGGSAQLNEGMGVEIVDLGPLHGANL